MSKARRGNVFRKVKGGPFFCQWYVNGKQFVRMLRDADEEPITDKTEARKAADTLVRPYTAKDTVELRKEAVHALRDASEVAQAAEDAARPRLALADVWTRFPYVTNTRGAGERKLAERTVTGTRRQWEVFTTWATEHGTKYAEDVTAEHAEAFRRALPDTGHSADLVNRICVVCRMMFRRAGLAPNPFDGFRKLAYKSNGRRELTDAELRAVCGSATGELRTLYAVGLYTALRLGDACQLDWSEVAPDLSRIIRQPGKTRYRATEVVVPVHGVLATILAETPLERRSGPVLPDLSARYKANAPGVAKMIGEHFEKCGIRQHKEGTGRVLDPKSGKRVSTGKRAITEASFHSLRHSFVTMAARQGVPLHLIQALCGHSSPTVQRLYLHASTADVRKAIASLPSMTGPQALPAAVEPVDPACADLQAKIMALFPRATATRLQAALDALQG
jgi:integrase